VGRGGTLEVIGLERSAAVTRRADEPQNSVEVIDVPLVTLAHEVEVMQFRAVAGKARVRPTSRSRASWQAAQEGAADVK
jgi:hypothetical protein